ncbi:Vacuolar protein sorting-associated protein 28 [Metarhizium anisopliae]
MIPRQGYAPTPHSYVPNSSFSATINLDEEVKLTGSRAERDLQDSLAELFSIIVTLDELEKAFLKDAIPEAEYTEICERSLRQYKALLADETIAAEFQDLEEFKAKWDVGFTTFREMVSYYSILTILSSKHLVPPNVSV